MGLSGIPVNVNGTPAGCATINDDGTIELKLNPNHNGKQVLRGLERGQFAGLSILPIRSPGSRAADFKPLSTPSKTTKP